MTPGDTLRAGPAGAGRPMTLAEAHAHPAPPDLPAIAEDARWVAHDRLGDLAHVVVDGRSPARPLLELSHWPGCATPPALADVSATGIVARYLDAGPDGPAAVALTDNHFDVDGVLAAWLALARPRPEAAIVARARAAAEAGDYGTWTDEAPLRVALALEALAEARSTPLASVRAALAPGATRDPTGPLHEAVLPRVGRVLADPDRFAFLWGPAREAIAADAALLDAGDAWIEEVGALDLAVVRTPRPLRREALLPRTARTRVLTALPDGTLVLTQRYETWVAFASRALAPRVDLAPALPALARAEIAEGRWTFEGLAQSTPRLALVGPSGAPAASGIGVAGLLEVVGPVLAGAPGDAGDAC